MSTSREAVKECQRRMAELVFRYSKVSSRLDAAIERREAVVAAQDELVARAQLVVAEVVSELASEFGQATAAKLLGIPSAEVGRSERQVDRGGSAADHRAPMRGKRSVRNVVV